MSEVSKKYAKSIIQYSDLKRGDKFFVTGLNSMCIQDGNEPLMSKYINKEVQIRIIANGCNCKDGGCRTHGKYIVGYIDEYDANVAFCYLNLMTVDGKRVI